MCVRTRSTWGNLHAKNLSFRLEEARAEWKRRSRPWWIRFDLCLAVPFAKSDSTRVRIPDDADRHSWIMPSGQFADHIANDVIPAPLDKLFTAT